MLMNNMLLSKLTFICFTGIYRPLTLSLMSGLVFTEVGCMKG